MATGTSEMWRQKSIKNIVPRCVQLPRTEGREYFFAHWINFGLYLLVCCLLISTRERNIYRVDLYFGSPFSLGIFLLFTDLVPDWITNIELLQDLLYKLGLCHSQGLFIQVTSFLHAQCNLHLFVILLQESRWDD